jgi:hypothetical protein
VVPIAGCHAAKGRRGRAGLRVGSIHKADVTVLGLTVRIPWPFVYLDFLGSVVILSQFRYEPTTHLFQLCSETADAFSVADEDCDIGHGWGFGAMGLDHRIQCNLLVSIVDEIF